MEDRLHPESRIKSRYGFLKSPLCSCVSITLPGRENYWLPVVPVLPVVSLDLPGNTTAFDISNWL